MYASQSYPSICEEQSRMSANDRRGATYASQTYPSMREEQSRMSANGRRRRCLRSSPACTCQGARSDAKI
jgi:hypothetical protein